MNQVKTPANLRSFMPAKRQSQVNSPALSPLNNYDKGFINEP
jgi:hypothetical protein